MCENFHSGEPAALMCPSAGINARSATFSRFSSQAFIGRLALGIADRVWTVGDLLDAALATQPIMPTGNGREAPQSVSG